MTFSKKASRKRSEHICGWRLYLTVLLTLFLAFFKSADISNGVRSGLLLSATVVIPSVFPFMILSDMISKLADDSLVIMKPIRYLFGADGGSKICLVGFLCGFPTAAKCAAEAYRIGAVEKREAERLAAVGSVPSPSFIIGAVGISTLGDKMLGMKALLALLAAAVVTSNIFRGKKTKIEIRHYIPRQNFDFVDSVKNAGTASLTVSAFVTLFYTLSELIKKSVKNDILLYIVLPFLEVSTAVNQLGMESFQIPIMKYIILGFSLGFSGICAAMQCGVYLKSAGLSVKRFLAIKLSEGVFTALFCAIIFSF